MRTWTVSIALLFTLALPGIAHADVVGSPPDSCDDGARPSTCHALNGYCRPATCDADDDCTASEHCGDARLCIHDGVCSGRSTTHVEVVTGTCDPGSCGTGSSCETRRVCVSGARLPDGGTEGGDTHAQYGCCSTAATRGAAGGALVIASLAALVIVRRSRR